jgi:hypothetical protein
LRVGTGSAREASSIWYGGLGNLACEFLSTKRSSRGEHDLFATRPTGGAATRKAWIPATNAGMTGVQEFVQFMLQSFGDGGGYT